jgi:putative membrane protein
MLLYAIAILLGSPTTATIIVIMTIGCYLLYRGLGLDELFHSVTDALKISLYRGRFSFVAYIFTIVLVVIGFTEGAMMMMRYAVPENDFGILHFFLTFAFGSIQWLIAAGLLASVGIIYDVIANERENLGKVIVFPFFVVAIGLIFWCASVYILAGTGATGFLMTEAQSMSIIYLTAAGIISALCGVFAQYYINRRMAEQQKQEIIEVIRS